VDADKTVLLARFVAKPRDDRGKTRLFSSSTISGITPGVQRLLRFETEPQPGGGDGGQDLLDQVLGQAKVGQGGPGERLGCGAEVTVWT
jgi:hypothetical protein